MEKKSALQLVALLMIGGVIAYLEVTKPATVSNSLAPDIIVSKPEPLVATTTQVTPVQSAKKRVVQDKNLPKAKEIADLTGFVNTAPFTLSSLAGSKVILLDFWTYSCINCRRTTPYLNAWYKKYKDLGFTIVGVHTPEFDFEKDIANVKNGTKELGIEYPVVLDSNYGTWNAYNNRYWPHEFLIDIDGYIIHDKIGEGGYDDTEREIQKALQERSDALGLGLKIPSDIAEPLTMIPFESSKVGSPETYFGSARNEYFANGSRGRSGIQVLKSPETIDLNKLYLDGSWNIQNEFAENTTKDAKITYKFSAKNVYLVASSEKGVHVKVMLDGKPQSTILIKDNRLYDLIKGSDYSEHTLELQIDETGLNAFAFTFG